MVEYWTFGFTLCGFSISEFDALGVVNAFRFNGLRCVRRRECDATRWCFFETL
jgi:hypothetical protein